MMAGGEIRPAEAAEDFTVVICTRDRPAQLERTLDALTAQGPDDFELVVVDQSASPNAALARRGAADPRIVVVPDDGRGLSRARNIGWRRARTEWVVFIDDDCRPQGEWATPLRDALHSHPEIGFVSGHVADDTRAGELIPVATFPVAAERVRSGRWTRPSAIGFGVFMAVRRSAIERLGGWDERLGPGVPSFPAADDMDFNYRFLRAGGVALATPNVRVLHAQWRSSEELGRLLEGYMAANSALAVKHLRTGDPLGGAWHWWSGIYFLCHMLASGVRRRSRLRVGFALRQLRGLVVGTARALTRPW